MDQNVSTPGRARTILTTLRILMGVAIDDGMRGDDPTAGIKKPKTKNADGWRCWSEEEIAQFEAHHPIGSQARLALALAVHTGQRRSDLVRMGKQHIRNGCIELRQQKTKAPLAIPIHPELQSILDATPSDHLTFLTTRQGGPFCPDALAAKMRVWSREAGLQDAPLHGLRKASCRRLAEAGCTVHEIAAISGHKSLREVERYTKAADQRRMAAVAIARVK
jgi:integrase